MLGAMTVRPASGPAVFRPGTRTASTWRRADPVTTGHVLRVPAPRLRDLASDWFPFGVHLIKGLTQTVRTIESSARQRESLVALGTLAAGLAHEINNPASAATRAVDALDDTSQALMHAIARLADHSITAEQFAALDKLRQEIRPGIGRPRPIGRRQTRGRPVGLVGPARRRAGVGHRTASGRGRRGHRLVRTSGRGDRRRGIGAGPGMGGEFALHHHPAGRGQGIDPADLRPGWRGEIVFADGPGVDAEYGCQGRARGHPGRAWPTKYRAE